MYSERFAFVFCLIGSALLPIAASGATYYVDFVGGSDSNTGTSKTTPWKHVIGMVGCTGVCASTTPAGGDSIIFKGGVTWTSSFPWDVKGGSTTYVTYTTDHTWYSGSGYTQPIFSDGNVDRAGGAITSSAHHIAMNDLSFQNCGNQPATASSNQCVVFTNTHDVSITNSTFRPSDWIALYLRFTSAGSYSNFAITGNDFTKTSNAIWMATAAANAAIHNATITGNTYHDYHDNMVGGTHGNGFHFYGVPSSDASQYMDGLTYCNNRAYGDFTSNGTYVDGVSGGGMTAFFFIESAASGVVCNNDFSFSPVQANMFQSLISISKNNAAAKLNLGIYNNSLANMGTNAMSAGLVVGGLTSGDSMPVKNNIFSYMQYCVYVQDSGSGAAMSSDYNVMNCASGQNDYVGSMKTFAQWNALGLDQHSVLGKDPSWVAAPGNEHLNAGSPALVAGTNLSGISSILNSDAAGVARPASGAWDAGAFQGSTAATPPNAPTGLTAGAQ